MSKSAFIVGYTGESGKELVSQLIKCNPFTKVVLIGRRQVEIQGVDDKFQQQLIDFEQVDAHKDVFAGCKIGFCCLGTTRGKSGKEGFIKVDHDYILTVAKTALSVGCEDFHLVSSMGANANSWFLYSKVKGQVEKELQEMGFKHVFVYQPAVLLCNREESRPMESMTRSLLKPISWVAPTLITTPTVTLAKAMLAVACQPDENKTSYKVYQNEDIFKLGEQGDQMQDKL